MWPDFSIVAVLVSIVGITISLAPLLHASLTLFSLARAAHNDGNKTYTVTPPVRGDRCVVTGKELQPRWSEEYNHVDK